MNSGLIRSLPLLVCLFAALFPHSLRAQDVVNPSRVVIFTDGARITQKGILRFTEKKARFTPFILPEPGSVEINRSNEYNLQFMKFLQVQDTMMMPVTGWADVLEASVRRFVIITFQIGNEYDELAGDVLAVNRTSNLALIRNKNGQDVFMPLDQVRQVQVEFSNGSLVMPRLVSKPMIEIGIDKELPFAPVEFSGNITGLRWIPNCKLRMVDGKNARFQMSAVIENKSATSFDGVDLELAAGGLSANNPNPKVASWRYKPGRLSLKSGESVFLNLAETTHEYEINFTCMLPWKGPGPELRTEPQPVIQTLKMATPIGTAVACETVTVLDPEGKMLVEAVPAGGEISQLVLGMESAVKVVYQENGEYDEAKTVKQGDKVFKKVKFTGKIIISNLRSEGVSLKVSREINGEIISNGNGTVESAANPSLKLLTWQRNIRPGSNETISYEYYALLPQD